MGMADAVSASTTSAPPGRLGRVDLLAAVLGIGAWVLLGFFARWFEPGWVQWDVTGLWLAAMLFWIAGVRVATGSLLPAYPTLASSWPLTALLTVFVAAWLPFYDNWRWACTGDSIAWYATAAGAALNGLPQGILSVRGVDGHFTYLHSLGFNALMFVFEPTLFWHRVGKLIVGCLSLAAIYAYFTLTLGRWWGLAVTVGTAANYVWLRFSYVSYGHIDSHFFYFTTLAAAALVLRHPRHLGAWMSCGLVGGLSLFFTQTAWSAVVAAGTVLAAFGLFRGWIAGGLVYAGSFLLAASPLLLQLPGLLEMTTRQAQSLFEWSYLLRIFRVIVWLGYDSPYTHIALGPFLRWPLGPLFPVGAVLAALAAVPPLRRRLRLPAIAPIMLALLLWDAVLMTLTNNAYHEPSIKRAYNLIPLQVVLALVPAYFLVQWCGARRGLRRLAAGAVASGLCVYVAANMLVLIYPAPAMYGLGAFDGFVELRQRFADRTVVLLTTREDMPRVLARDSFFHQAYKVADQLVLEARFEDDVIERACAEQAIVCYEPNLDRTRFDPLQARHARRLVRLPLLNSVELICYQCVRPRGG
jgi:hypothetical protein